MAVRENWAKVFGSRHQYKDSVPVQFGNAKDVAIQWDGTNLTIKPVADDTGSFNIGDGTTDIDIKVFLGTSTAFVLFDVGNVSLVVSAGVTLSVDATTDTTSAVTGSIHTDGGVGIAKALWVGTTSRLVGNVTLDGAIISDLVTDTSSATTGAIQTDGGVGIAKALWVGTTSRLVGAATFDGAIISDAVTDTSSTTTGAIQTDGGLGIAKALWVGTTSRLVGAITADATLGIAGLVTSTSVTGFRSNPTFVPDETRTNYAFSAGNRVAALTVTIGAGATQHLDPFQLNILVAGVNPGGSSTLNGFYQLITHSTAMANMRLKNADWNIVMSANVLDAYCYQGELDFTSSMTVGGEAAVLGLVANASAAVTGNIRGAIISMQGTGTYATAVGLEIRTTCGTGLGSGLSEGIRIAGTPLPVVGIAMGNQTNDNEGPQNAFFFPSIGGADEGPCVVSGTSTGAITIKIGAATRYIRFWATA